MNTIVALVYLLAAVLFIIGLKELGSARTARRGNFISLIGMLLAMAMTLVKQGIVGPVQLLIGLVVGTTIGIIAAKRVAMTAMPQMVALFNGFGGIASTLVAYSELIHHQLNPPPLNTSATIFLSLLIGTVTFTGSVLAYAKLEGIVKSAPVVLPAHQALNFILLAAAVVFGVLYTLSPGNQAYALTIVALAAVFGITFVLPIGGADMPVVISLLNAYSGLAAAMTGFVLSNNMLIISGALVGASGIILTQIMCEAMNRSLANVLFGAVGAVGAGGEAEGQRTVTRYTAADAAMILNTASSVIIVPGYGLAVAQAQHVLHEAAQILMDKGLSVRYAIHPVAGRMPGHMNVLLAEANVPYDLLYEMENINDDFQNTDVVLVVGANDVVNPAARYKKNSPLYGMPILNVDQARTVMFIKRSLSPGFAGEPNPLFYDDKTMMVFGDAKKVLTDLVKELKQG